MRQLRTEVHTYMNSLNFDVNGLLDFKNNTATTVRLKFDEWLKEELRGDQFKSIIGKPFYYQLMMIIPEKVGCLGMVGFPSYLTYF